MPDRQAAIEHLRERSAKRWMASATVTRAERSVTDPGIGTGRFCSRQRWAGRTAGRVERGSVRRSGLYVGGLKGVGVRVAGANGVALSDWTTIREGAIVRSAGRGPAMPVTEWQAGSRAAKSSLAESGATEPRWREGGTGLSALAGEARRHEARWR